MDLPRFAQFHLPALEAGEIRFNVQVAVLRAATEGSTPGFSYWTVGGPGHCAIQSPGRAILLCALERSECEELARDLQDLDYPGVAGADQTAHWFVEQATKLGLTFEDPIPQRLHVLSSAPHYPAAPGSPRKAEISDLPLLFEWLEAFRSEAVPHDPPPERASIEKSVASGRFFFWTNNGRPVSVAAICRRLRDVAAVAPVYTPPEERSRGYAGSVTAAVAERCFAEGKRAVCLYTDLRNPISNRCYAKIGFTPYCDSALYLRLTTRK